MVVRPYNGTNSDVTLKINKQRDTPLPNEKIKYATLCQKTFKTAFEDNFE